MDKCNCSYWGSKGNLLKFLGDRAEVTLLYTKYSVCGGLTTSTIDFTFNVFRTRLATREDVKVMEELACVPQVSGYEQTPPRCVAPGRD